MTRKTVSIADVVILNPRMPRSYAENLSQLVAFVPMAAVSECGVLGSYSDRPLGEVIKGFTYFEAGDVLVAKITPCMENGKACLVPYLDNKVGFGSTEFHVLRATDAIDPRYLFHCVWNDKFRRDAEKNMTGSAGQKRVPTHFFGSYKIPLPALPEQKRIAAILDKADAIRRKREKAIELTDSFLRSVFLEMFGDPNIPKVKLADVASQARYALSSGPFGSNLTSKHYVDDGVIVLRGLNISSGKLSLDNVKYISEVKAEELKRSEVRPNDIVVVAVGASGCALRVPEELPRAIMSQNFNKISPDVSKISPVYLEHCLNSRSVQAQLGQHITDTVRTFLSLTKLKDILIPLPERGKQERFAEIVFKVNLIKSKQEGFQVRTKALLDSLASDLLAKESSPRSFKVKVDENQEAHAL